MCVETSGECGQALVAGQDSIFVAPLSGPATHWFVLSRVCCAIRSLESPPRHVAMHIPGRHSYFTHIHDGDTYISLLGMLASSLTASSAEIKAATEKRIEPSTKSSSPIGGHRRES